MQNVKADYERFATEDDGRRFASLAKPQDMSRPRRYTMFQNQHVLRAETLRRIETDPKRREILPPAPPWRRRRTW